MEIRNYNGAGRWSAEGICDKYREYCKSLRMSPATKLRPIEHVEGGVKWVYPLMDWVIRGIKAGDKACTAIGVDFIQEDQRFPFGNSLKSNTARALRQAELTGGQKERIRRRVAGMLTAGNVPHEFGDYARLLRRVGLGAWWPAIEKGVYTSNPYVIRHYRNLKPGN